VHSNYSPDSLITPEQLIFYAKKRGLDGIAVTDHNRLDGALNMAKATDFLIVPGMEITSAKGHVLGLNVREQIPKGLSVDETVDKIHEAGGTAIACHPYAPFKMGVGDSVNSKFDAVEVINSSAFPFRRSVKHAELIAARLGIGRVAGSDAHYGPEIGCAYTIVEAEQNCDEICKAINKGLCQPFGCGIPLKTRLKRELALLKRRF
jgi:predicted metal-dependent phosphoesterase TrpH